MTIAPPDALMALEGRVAFYSAWLDPIEADAFFAALRRDVPWTQGTITLFGRQILEPRLTAWYGDDDYTYSGRTVRATPWTEPLASLRQRVERATRAPFNAVLLNLYRDGRDSMGLHSDDEPELGHCPVIASVSLGATRRFLLAPKKKGTRREGTYEIGLTHGSLLVMTGDCQHRYRHGVPKQPRIDDARINLTFRRIVPA